MKLSRQYKTDRRKIILVRDKTVTMKCSETELDRIRKGALKCNLPVSAYLRELGTEGGYTRTAKKRNLIASIVRMTQLYNEMDEYPQIQNQIKDEVKQLWQSYSI